jgi:hypothetical protein
MGNMKLKRAPGLVRISHTFEGRNKQTQTLSELRSLRCGYFREHGINGENCVCAVPARHGDLVSAYCEKCAPESYEEGATQLGVSYHSRARPAMIGEVIVVLEDGVKLHIRATPRDGQLELASSITFSEIGDDDTFTYNSKEVAEQVIVQILHQEVRRVDLVQQLEDGASLLVDPHFFKETTLKKRFRADVTTRQYTLLLISARVIDSP